MTADLVAFLKARLDEDKQVARAALPGPWAVDELRPSVLATDDSADVVTTRTDGSFGGVATDHEGFGACSKADARHIARHDPARVLREVKAKRRIIDLHSAPAPDSIGARAYSSWPYHCEGCGYAGDAGENPITEHVDECPILRLLALPYVDHPDYREGWKP